MSKVIQLLNSWILYSYEILFIVEYCSIFRATNDPKCIEITMIIYSRQIGSALRKCIINFIKLCLGFKKCDVAAKSEVYILILYKKFSFIIFSRINCNEKNPIVKDVFKVNKPMHEVWIYTCVFLDFISWIDFAV